MRPPPDGVQLFGAAFSGPHDLRRTGGALRFTVLARLDGIKAAEVLALVARHRLRLAWRLHAGGSGSAVEQAGHAAMEADGADGLRCRVLLPDAAFGAQPVRLLHLGLLYEGRGTFEEWGRPGAWLALGAGRSDPFQRYFAGFNADRA